MATVKSTGKSTGKSAAKSTGKSAGKSTSVHTATSKKVDRVKPASQRKPAVKRPSTSTSDSLTAIARRRDKASSKGSLAYQERRREIAKAAAEVFNKRGFRGTSLSAVAQALGTDRASLYYYIENKRELFDEVVREVSDENVATAEEVLASQDSAIEKLRVLIVKLMQSYATHYPILYVYIRENLSHVESDRTAWSKHMRGLNRRYEEVFVEIIESGMADGTIKRIGSARTIAFGVIGMIGWTNRWFDPSKSEETGEEIGETFANLALAGLIA
jgi:TetR/AcrR family transcriptional regulator, cholesterol catabolism regulator